MKKLLLALFILPISLFAQEDETIQLGNKDGFYRWEIGLNGGVNFSGVSGLADSTAGSLIKRAGRLYGGTVVYHFNKFIAFKTDFDFENKGWTLSDQEIVTNNSTGITDITDINQYLNYFDIPAFLHVGFGNRLKFDFNFGPYFAFLLQDKAFYTNAAGEQIELLQSEFTGYNNFDWGITYGGGIDFALFDRVSLGFDLLYQQGLTAIKEGTDLKNTSLDFDFGINFSLGKK
jgi:hypothetical protein